MVTLTKNIYPPSEKIDKIAAGYLITPKIPQGLAAAAEGLTREVIRHAPKDIYTFAAQHFEKLLELREQYSRTMDQQWNVYQDSIYCDLKDYYKDDYNQFNDRITSKYAKYNKIQKNEEYLKHKRKKAYGREIKKSSPKVISGLMAANKDIKNKLKKNRISTQQNKKGALKNDKVVITKLDSMDKVKSYVVDKFAQTTNVEELQTINYTEVVQTIINHNAPVINKKMEELKSNKTTQQTKETNKDQSSFDSPSVLETRLNETHNLLKDISSCFPKLSLQSRPRSADAVHNYARYCSASDKLEAMLNETHHLLLGISNNFFRPNDLQKSKSEDNEQNSNIYLPSVPSTSIASPINTQQNSAKNGSLTFALPPVISSCPSSDPPKSAKKQNLILPILLNNSENSSTKADDSDAKLQNENSSSDSHDEKINEHQELKIETRTEEVTGVMEIEEHSRKETPKELCYMLTSTESPLFQIPYNVTTVIIPDRSNMYPESMHEPCLTDPFSSLIGEVVNTTLASEEFNKLQPAFQLAAIMTSDKTRYHKQNLQSINEEDISDDREEDQKVILEEITDDDKLTPVEKIILEEVVDDGKKTPVEKIILEEIVDDDKITSAKKITLEEITDDNTVTSLKKVELEEIVDDKNTTLIEKVVLEEILDDRVVTSIETDELKKIVDDEKEIPVKVVLQETVGNETITPVEKPVLEDIDEQVTHTEEKIDLAPDEEVLTDEEKMIINDQENFELNNSELSSTAKETSATDGPLDSPVIYEKTESGLSVSKSTDIAESSNEAKETTLTDGVSLLSLDDPVRPYVPELNLDSLQDITVSSFKMTEDECDLQADDDIDRTNSITENETLNLNDFAEGDEFAAAEADIDADKLSYVIASDIINRQVLHSPEEMHEDVCELEQYVPQRLISEQEFDNSISIDKKEVVMEENKESVEEVQERQNENNANKVQSGAQIMEPDNDKSESIKEQESKRVILDLSVINPSAEDSVVLETLLMSQESIELHHMEDAVIRIQAGIRGFLIRRRITKRLNNSYNSSVNMLATSEEKVVEPPIESEEQNMMKLQDTAAKTIQNNFRNYQTRKRLYRENAMQKTTTISREKINTDIEEIGLQHTGEFHDCIALPLHSSLDIKPIKEVNNKSKEEIEDKV